MQQTKKDGLVRISVISKLKRTSVSLDEVLFRALIRDQGDSEKAIQWIRICVSQIEALSEVNDPSVDVSKAGLSRLVQRMALAHLLKIDLTTHAEPPV